MKTMAALILTLGVGAVSACALAAQPAKPEDDSDVTIAIMDEGETPAEFSHEIVLPHVSNIVHAGFDKHVDAQLHRASEASSDAGQGASENASQTITDSLSIDGGEATPGDITTHSKANEPLLNGVPANPPAKSGGN